MKLYYRSLKTLSLFFCCSSFLNAARELRWDWDTIDFSITSTLPYNFLWGASASAFQTEGIETVDGKTIQNSWTAWEEEIISKDGILQSRIPVEKRVGYACHHWTRYPQDFQLAKDIGLNAYRFSLEWSKIEPQKGVFDEGAMQHYIEYVKEMLAKGLVPIITLFHHTCPLWFNAHHGGFEDERNNVLFIEYALYVFRAFNNAGLLKDVKMWVTLNEPVGYALASYMYAKLPPGKRYRFRRSGTVAKNMLEIHVTLYDVFKQIDPDVQVGLTHIMQPIQPYYAWNPFDQLVAKMFDYLVNDVIFPYFKTGHFNWLWLIKGYNPDAIGKIDFIGVNYYSHTLIKMFKESVRPDEKLSDPHENKPGKALYPEGLYISLQKAAQLEIPIFVTENGFATEKSELREEYIKKHLYVIYKALQEGMDIRGYFFWTLTDCFGWNGLINSKHGIYQVDFTTQERTLRESARAYLERVQEEGVIFK